MPRAAIVARHNIAKERTIVDFERQDNDWYVEPTWVVDRPSMPPGGSGIEAKGGTADYCWIVWNQLGGDTRVSWLF